jgi:hypothetical protein
MTRSIRNFCSWSHEKANYTDDYISPLQAFLGSMNLPYLFLIGDSIALHYTEPLKRYLTGRFEMGTRQGYREAIKNLDHPRGANCGDSSMVLSFVDQVVMRGERRPDFVALNCGLHDIKIDPASGLRQVNEADYAANLAQIFERFILQNIPVIWINTTPVPDERHRRCCPEISRYEKDVAAYNSIAAKCAHLHEMAVIDLHGFTENLGPDVYLDHVHYTIPARELQAAFLSGALTQWAAKFGGRK